jgi:tetratricopeptide (TPR) repeat protein
VSGGNLVTRALVIQALLALSLTYPVIGTDDDRGAAHADQSQVIGLNNDGVKALNSGNFQLAVQKFKAALQLDPTYQLAKDNLAIAYNNYGLQLQKTPKEALKQFHMALMLNRTNQTTLQNVEGIIRMMGKNPKSFADRVALGDEARLGADFDGAIIEYSEALKLKDDPKIHIKLGDVYRVRDRNDEAIAEYQAAARTADSADVEVKLGQAYQAKKDIPDAIAAYGKAIQFKSDDTDVQDALVAGWEEALKENPLAPENHIGLGQAYSYRGDFSQAKEEYNQAIRFSPGKQNATAQRLLAGLPALMAAATVNKNINLGVDAQSRQQYDQAIAFYDQALKADPNNADVWVNKGTAYQAKKDYDNAIMCYQKAKQIAPNNQAADQGIKTASEEKQDQIVSTSYKAGGDLFKQGKYAEAVAAFQQVLKINPQDAATHFSLGATYQAMKNIDGAIAEYKVAQGLDPKNPEYAKTIAAAYQIKADPLIADALKKYQAKDYQGAIDLYTQAAQLLPQNPALWYNVASAEYARQEYERAKAAYQKALDIDPKGQVSNIYFIGAIDENYGRGSDAMADYRKYITQAPQGTYVNAAKDRIAALSKNINDTQKIKSEAELAAIKAADDAYTQAVKLQQAKQFDQALEQYNAALKIQPNNPDFNYGIGTCYQQKGDMDNAVAFYKKAQAANPQNKDYQKAITDATDLKAGPLIDQAVAKQTGGDPTGAIDLYKQAIQLVPNNARLWTNVGTAYQQTDQWQLARDAYQKGYDLDNKGEVGNLYLMGALDENFGNGAKALGEYQKYLTLQPKGSYAAAAQDRVKALSANINAVQKLQTQSDIKGAQEAGAAYDQAVKLQQASKFDDAIPLYQKAMQLQPRESAYVYALGTDYQAKGDIDNAIANYEKALSMAPGNKDYQNILAAAKTLKAAPIMDEAVKKHTAGDFAAAIPLYIQALQIAPNNAHGYTNLAGAYQSSDDFANARANYQKALDLDPKGEVDNYYFIGLLDENAGQGAKALQDYMKYVQVAPRGTYATQAQGRISALRANPNATQKITTQAETQKSAEAQTNYDAAVKLQGENKLDDAIASYNKAIAISPNEPSYYYAEGTAYQAKNDIDKAIELYKKAAALNPKEPTYKNVLKQANQAKAAPLLDSAIKKQTTKTDKGDYDLAGAVADYEAALKIDPDDPTAHMNAGTAYQAMNNMPKAVAEYKRSIALDPKLGDPHYFLGTAYEAMKQPALALAEYKEYLRLAPTGSYAASARDQIKALGGGKR